MRFSSGPIPLYREFVEVSSCEIFRPKAHRLGRYSVAKSKTVFSRNPILRRKMRVACYPDPRSKTVDILLKALQITFPTQKSDPKSVKRFPSYCPKTLPFFAKSAEIHLEISALNGLAHLLSLSNCQARWI